MNRRQVIAMLGNTAIGWPLGTHAQSAGMPVIGYLGAQSQASFVSRVLAFRQGLGESGYIEGMNVLVEYRWAGGDGDKLSILAAELAERRVAVLVAPGGIAGALAAKSATTTIPIVFEMGADPIASGLVQSLNRPGGNLTGVSSLNVEVTPKRLEILHALKPEASAFAALVNPVSPTAPSQLAQLEAAGQARRLPLHVLRASSMPEVEAALESWSRLGVGGLVVTSDGFFGTHGAEFAKSAMRHAVAMIHQSRDFAVAGGLVSYGGNFVESHRQAGVLAGRLLKGEKPAELPVQLVTKVQLTINIKAARALDINVPLSLLLGADEVIE